MKIRTLLSVFVLSFFSSSVSAQIVLLVQEPSNLSGSYDFTYSSSNGWGADMDTVAITAQAAFALDATSADSLGCDDIVSSVSGKVAVVYRGDCEFSQKALNAQDAGAVAVVIVNNVPGGPVGMGGGAVAAQVVIPVVMISDSDGALLSDSIAAGSVEMFLGNNTGLYANNVGSYKANVASANSYSIPAEFAQSSSDFSVPIAAWVYNFGSAEAVNAVVTAVVDRDGNEIYNETSTGSNILPGDSMMFLLPDYVESGVYTPGFYTITYTIVTDATDEFPNDNVVTVSFWINEEGTYSKSTVDPQTGPVSGNGIRPADSQEYEWCIALQSENASDLQITGITFSTLTNDIDLTGEAVQLSVYEWNDPISSTEITFDDLTELTDNEFYDYSSDLQGEFVTQTFAEPIDLEDELKYLACATIFIDDMFLGTDASLDYNVMYETYLDEVFFPVNNIDGGQWFPGGFGTDNVPAIIVNLATPNGIAENTQKIEITPYPNPTIRELHIPVGSLGFGDIVVEIFDSKGSLVRTDDICQKSNNLKMDVSNLTSGLHTFNLTFEDQSTSTFQVVITR